MLVPGGRRINDQSERRNDLPVEVRYECGFLVRARPEGGHRRWGIFSPDIGIVGVEMEMPHIWDGCFEVWCYHDFEAGEERSVKSRFETFGQAQEHARKLLVYASERERKPQASP